MAVVTQTMQDQVTELYLGFFGRAPDAAGFGYWTEKLANGTATVEGIANGFSNTPEFIANYGGLTPVQQVTKIYLNVLNRAPDAGGLAYWTGLLNSGYSIGAVTFQIVDAAFQQVGTADGLLVQNKVTVGEYFAITLASNDTALAGTAYNLVTSAASSVVAAEAAITQGSGGTWALTTGIDTLTHGPFANFVGTVTVGGTNQTLNAGDTITGVGAGNVLRVVDTTVAAGTPMSGVALTGVQELQVQVAGAGANNSNYNVSTATGLTKVTSANSTQSGVTFSGLAAGTTVQVSGSASTANTTSFTYATASSSPTITFNGGVTSQTVSATAGTATSAVINSIGGTNGTTSAGVAQANAVKFTGAASSLTSLTVNATTNLRTTVLASDFAAAGADLVVNGAAGSVNLGGTAALTSGNYKTINASGLTGGLTVNASTVLTSFQGGQGNDSLTNNSGGNAAIASTASINAGAGVDTVAGTLVNAGNASVFSNFEQIATVGMNATLDVSLMTNSTITGITISGALGGASGFTNLVETAAGFNVTVSGSAGAATTLGFTSASVAGTSDAVNYTFADTSGNAIDAGTVTHQGIEIVNIVSGGVTGSSNTLTIVDNALQSVTVTGAYGLTLTGPAQAAIGSASTNVFSTVNASGLTGTTGLTFVEQATTAANQVGLTITGSAGADNFTVLTLAAASLNNGGDTLTLGAGNDNVNVSGASARLSVSGTTVAMTTITDLAAGDTISFGGTGNTFNATAVNVSSATSFVAALNIALAANNVANRSSWFEYGNNTYIVDNVGAGATIEAQDIVVKLTGSVDLSSSSISGTGVLTIA